MDDLSMRLFRLSTEGFCCAQIMYKLCLEDEGIQNDDLIKSAQGLCRGIADTQQTCGVLSGGIGVLGLYAAKGKEGESEKENIKEMIAEFHEWFKKEFGSTQCVDLIGVKDFYGSDQSYKPICADMLQKAYIKVCEILLNHGYEYGNRECIS
ncbi:DVU_1555 family C-GCAxxG-C-C protein [Sulfurospirillum arcachonense]|uniref:DVU_1555 family C-GCAxxG-C-C protein n=1 Tax=Sulfurospirillum arcachonense TaxID=57666 RepID=UPI000469672E|nr:DV_1555 family C-GCAxxG-C-C protein [Sulfurospirillum arcachonense]